MSGELLDDDVNRALRNGMVREQIESRGITDPRVLDALRRVPRHLFVAPGFAAQAHDDMALPAPHDQTISQPYMVAAMTEALQLTEGERVLEVGTGTGYQTAVLVTMGARVSTIERIPALLESARERLSVLSYGQGVRFAVGDGTRGWPDGGGFDAVIVAAAAPRPPRALVNCLERGGRLVLPLGDRTCQHVVRFTRTSEGIEEECLVACVFVPLIGHDAWSE